MKISVKKSLLGALLAVASMFASAADQPYKIGFITDATGPMQGTFRDTWVGFKLFVDDLNGRGGVNGRPIDVTFKDVQSDTQKSVNAVHELAAAGVSGIGGLAVSSTHTASYAAAEQYGLPIVVGFPPNFPIVLEPAQRNIFGAGDVFTVSNQITGKIARNLSPEGKKLACVAFQAPGSILSCETTIASAKAQGFEAEIFVVPQNQRDFRPIVASLMKFAPDVITDCFGQSHFIGLIPALGAVGYDGIYLSYETGIGDVVKRNALKAAPDLQFYTYSRFASGAGLEKEGEQAVRLLAAAQKAGIPEVIAAHSGGWVLGQIVAKAFERCEGDCKPEQFIAALEKTDVAPSGLTGAPVKFSATDHYGPTAYRVYQYNHDTTAFTSLGDWYQLPPGKQAAR